MIIFLFILNSCFSKKDLEKPIHQYLSKGYGLNKDFNIVYADNNWVEGIDHHTVIELKKPYHAYIYFKINRDTYKIERKYSDDVFLDVFNGAYIEQHPKVVETINKLIEKYGCIKASDKFQPNNDIFDIFPFDNIRFNIETKQQKKLEENFKKTQKIDTIALLPSLKPNNPPKRYGGDFGVVNFIFNFDLNKNKHSIPRAEDIVTELQKSGVLTEGFYNVQVIVDDHNPDISKKHMGRDFDSIVVIRVDGKGNFTIISKPNPDEI
jgi:hypothetical protein